MLARAARFILRVPPSWYSRPVILAAVMSTEVAVSIKPPVEVRRIRAL